MKSKFIESETIELKVQYTDDIRKEILAFANGVGGSVYVGVADDGTIVGVENADFVIQQITNSLRDNIRPDISMFVNYTVLESESKQYIEVKVQRGTSRPYYLASKGLRPAGVYVRQGTSTVPATDFAIRAMIKDTDGELFENMRSLNQDLTFEYASKVFAERKLNFGYVSMCTLKMIVDDYVYTNLALLLSDQCPHIIKAAKFNGVDQEHFQDRCEFEGSLLKQLDDAYAYLLKYNKVTATFDGLLRIDTPDYPVIALRESLLNAIIHRDYSILAPTLLSIYDDRVEIASYGGLVEGTALKDLLDGLSVCRNPQLANIFYRLRLIEAYGTGLQRIQRAYGKNGKKATFVAGAASFRVVLENFNYDSANFEELVADKIAVVVDNEEKILRVLMKEQSVSRQEVEKILSVSQATASRIIRNMVDKGRLKAVGTGKNRRYFAM